MMLRFYCTISDILKTFKKHEMTIIIGDMNAKIGQGKSGDLIGNSALLLRIAVTTKISKMRFWCYIINEIVLSTILSRLNTEKTTCSGLKFNFKIS